MVSFSDYELALTIDEQIKSKNTIASLEHKIPTMCPTMSTS